MVSEKLPTLFCELAHIAIFMYNEFSGIQNTKNLYCLVFITKRIFRLHIGSHIFFIMYTCTPKHTHAQPHTHRNSHTHTHTQSYISYHKNRSLWGLSGSLLMCWISLKPWKEKRKKFSIIVCLCFTQLIDWLIDCFTSSKP